MLDPGPLPLFPLPELLLYPEAVVPLHLFEPRYRRMMADMVQSGQDRLVIAALRPGYEATYCEAPDFYDLAGVGRVVKCRRLPDGRWNVIVRGEARVKVLREAPRELPYRRVEALELPEPPIAEPQAGELRARLAAALQLTLGADLDLPPAAAPGYLADVLLLQLALELPARHALFALVDPATRAEAVLEAFTATAGASPPPAPGAPPAWPDDN